MRQIILGFAVAAAIAVPASAQSSDGIKGVIAANAKVELVQEGYKFTEGPVGTAKGELYFTDNRADQILLLNGEGKISLAYDKTDNANGLALSKSGELFEVQGGGKKVGKHYGGPSWEYNDGSAVVGEVVASSPSASPNSIPQLLVRAKATAGKGLFSSVQFIQRLNTVGGSVPAGGCRKEQAGQQLRAQYSADYLFYGVKH